MIKPRIKTRKSRLWNVLKIFFPGADMSKVYLAFGNTIYMPPDVTECPESMLIHEGWHLRQQGYSKLKAVIWWLKYIRDKDFRYDQELEAYKTQWVWFNKVHKNATYQQKYQYRQAIASILASPMYGNITTTQEAFKALGEA